MKMTREQNRSYYGALAVKIGSNAITRVCQGSELEACLLASNAAKMAFLAYPYLRGTKQ